ncbi:imidazolonepropionase [Natronospira proteinivora]|uniref:Imidazolonepropionase n=1 Tax=Natronospira proteinivora TaxID=1807133 RepID=A0ABT1G7F6_9GAMM|nr:imidazolonepropionase [Natronospira proteinivora]MCP1727156.1 imidazolonepropionase [Natronospira proteinivora]
MAGSIQQAEYDSIAVQDGRIAALGVPDDASALDTVDAHGRVLMPGLVDCHTHVLYAGHRMDEHARKLEGASYEEIARSGGGILSTVSAVREASEEELVAQSLARVNAMQAEGVTLMEAKSGYGLDTANELKMLRAIRHLDRETAVKLSPTFLGAHSIPKDRGREAYMDELVDTTLPAVIQEGLAETCDIYVEKIAFTVEDMERLFTKARDGGLRLRAHTDQLSNMAATRRAAELGALSCDHLEYTEAADIKAMAEHGTAAVLLPGAFYFLRETKLPPIAGFRDAGVPMAVSTDINPGSSPVVSLQAAMHMAAIFFGMTAEEILLGVTLNAARAMGELEHHGSIEVGKQADLTLWDMPGPEFLVYQLGGIRPERIYIGGQPA